MYTLTMILVLFLLVLVLGMQLQVRGLNKKIDEALEQKRKTKYF